MFFSADFLEDKLAAFRVSFLYTKQGREFLDGMSPLKGSLGTPS